MGLLLAHKVASLLLQGWYLTLKNQRFFFHWRSKMDDYNHQFLPRSHFQAISRVQDILENFRRLKDLESSIGRNSGWTSRSLACRYFDRCCIIVRLKILIFKIIHYKILFYDQFTEHLEWVAKFFKVKSDTQKKSLRNSIL